jgi:hypothetical protein
MRTYSVSNYGVTAYAIVTLGVVFLTGVCQGMEQAGIHRGYGALFWLVVVGSALWLGMGPSLYAAVLSAVTFDFFFVPPQGLLALNAPLLFVASGKLIVAFAISHTMRRQQSTAMAVSGQFWQGGEGADWCADSDAGGHKGDDYLLRLTAAREGFLLGFIARDMIARGTYGGAEAGFFHRISMALLGANSLPLAALNDHAKNADMEHRVVEVDDDVKPRAVGM